MDIAIHQISVADLDLELAPTGPLVNENDTGGCNLARGLGTLAAGCLDGNDIKKAEKQKSKATIKVHFHLHVAYQYNQFLKLKCLVKFLAARVLLLDKLVLLESPGVNPSVLHCIHYFAITSALYRCDEC